MRNTEPFRSRQRKRVPHMENFTSVDGPPTRYRGTISLPRTERNFRKQSKPMQEVLDFKAVTIIDPTQADVVREKRRDRVICSRLVVRWKETDTGYKAKARWCVHGFKDPDIHEIERSCPTPELSSINITLQTLASTTSERESIHARRPECPRGTAVCHTTLKKAAGCARGSNSTIGPRSLRTRQWHFRVAITNRLSVKRGRLRDESVRTLPLQ